LALDYLKAGLLDRAEVALLQLEGTRFEAEARLALLANYERSRDWVLAAEVAQKLELADQGSFAGRRAHYLCEQAATLAASDDRPKAQQVLAQAIALAPGMARARLDLAHLQFSSGEPVQALATLLDATVAAPAAVALMAQPLRLYAQACGTPDAALVPLKAAYVALPSLDVLDAIVAIERTRAASQETARDWYVRHLEKQPSLVAAAQWIAGEKLEHEQFHPQVQRALDHAVKPLKRYRCAACGFEAQQHFWHCPGCQAWDSYPPRRVEEL